MASLAGMLQSRGHRVTGSDQNVHPPMSTQLEALGIEITLGYKAENADLPRDVTIVGNTIMRGNPELEEVLNRKFLYRSQAVAARKKCPGEFHTRRGIKLAMKDLNAYRIGQDSSPWTKLQRNPSQTSL